MIGVMLFGLVLTPVFYVVIRRLAGNRPLTQHESTLDEQDLAHSRVHAEPAE